MNLGLIPEGRALPNNILVGAGLVWSQLYPADAHYLPFMSVGLQYQYTNFRDKKTPMRFASKEFNAEGGIKAQASSNTDYKFSQSSLLATLKLDLYRWAYVMPYVNLELGASWNQAKQKKPFFIKFENTNISIIAPDSRNSTFSYSVGAGLDFPITENVWLSLGYNYNYFGHVSIKPFFIADNPEVNGVLNSFTKPFTLKHLSTQTIQLTGRYLFA